MNNKWLSSFMAVAQEGSVNAAAQSLYVSSQAMLQQINLLENEVGAKLFQRDRSGMTLTLAGREFLKFAQEAESAYATTLSRCRLASQAEEVIRIPMMSSIILPEFMERVCSEYRRNAVNHLRTEFITDEDFDHWIDGLHNLKYDIIEHFSIDGLVPHGIHFEYLSGVPTWCVMSDNHTLADKKILMPEDLEGHLILSPTSNKNLAAYFGIYIANAGIRVKIEEISNDRYQIIDGLYRGGVYLTNEEIAKILVGFHSVPLNFDNHVQHGLACREDMVDRYRHFFETSHDVYHEQEAAKRFG